MISSKKTAIYKIDWLTEYACQQYWALFVWASDLEVISVLTNRESTLKARREQTCELLKRSVHSVHTN